MGSDSSDPMDTFESWLLRRVAEAVEAGEVSADLLTDHGAEFATAGETTQEQGHAEAVQSIAKRLEISPAQATRILATIEGQSRTTREMLMRRIGEIWLEGHRKAYQSRQGPCP